MVRNLTRSECQPDHLDDSIGAASPAVETDILSAVLSRADEALYEAKRAGRGRAVRY